MYDLKTAEMIERLYCSDEINCYESFEDIELAFYNCDYYINPKSRNVKENFLLFSEYYEELNPKKRNAKYNFFLFSKHYEELPEKEQAPVLYDDRLRAKLYLKVIKDQFDYDYFKERLEFHKQYNDPECLREWMC